jgi:SPP1 family predicted phage head-tail adaptor
MTFANSLRHRVTVMAPPVGEDSVGQPLTTWAEFGKRWADVRVMGGLEMIKAGADTSTVKASVRMRYCTDIDASMRIIYAGVTYNIKAVLPDGGRRHVDFVCESIK